MKKVIIIEDSPTFCNMLGKKLEAKGWETILCYNYRDGLKAVRESSEWDVVISDMRLGNDERYRWKSRKALAMFVFPEQSSKILFVAKSFPSSLLIFSPLYASAPYNELPKLIFATIFPQTYGLVQQSHG